MRYISILQGDNLNGHRLFLVKQEVGDCCISIEVFRKLKVEFFQLLKIGEFFESGLLC